MDFEFLNNYLDAVCVFSENNDIVFKNKVFESIFPAYGTFDRFKKRFNFNLCFLSSENIKEITPIDILLSSKENFHTICTYQNIKDEIITYYIYSYKYMGYKIAVFRDITSEDSLSDLNKKYDELYVKYREIKGSSDKFLKLQEHAQEQVLKLGIINRISLLMRETSDMETILSSTLGEIHNLAGAFKTYFALKDKQQFKIIYSVSGSEDLGLFVKYEQEIMQRIKNKEITSTSCLKEYVNTEKFLQKGVKRIIIPVYNKNKLLGIIVTLTKQRFSLDDNKDILQSVSSQLSSSIIQAGLISQLNKKNKKLEKILKELKETQIQLINSEKMASLGQLVSGIAHEINTPLASISSNNNLIKKILRNNEFDSDRFNMLKELNDIDISAAERISNIVKSLKRFVRLDEAELQKADINKELDLTVKLIEHETKNDIKIIKKYSDIPHVLCRVNMLNQVFMNLLVNACHSIKEKGTQGEITVETNVIDGNLIVKIKDTGMGIPLKIQPKIFDVGFTTKKIGVGTGLGLSISKKIIELHKGAITFTSKENEGSEFIITIPV